MGDVYARSVAGQGYGAAVEAILGAYGTPDQVRDQLAGWDGAVDLAMIGLPPGLPWEIVEATLRAAAP
jgi:hypothetical protein